MDYFFSLEISPLTWWYRCIDAYFMCLYNTTHLAYYIGADVQSDSFLTSRLIDVFSLWFEIITYKSDFFVFISKFFFFLVSFMGVFTHNTRSCKSHKSHVHRCRRTRSGNIIQSLERMKMGGKKKCRYLRWVFFLLSRGSWPKR